MIIKVRKLGKIGINIIGKKFVVLGEQKATFLL